MFVIEQTTHLCSRAMLNRVDGALGETLVSRGTNVQDPLDFGGHSNEGLSKSDAERDLNFPLLCNKHYTGPSPGSTVLGLHRQCGII